MWSFFEGVTHVAGINEPLAASFHFRNSVCTWIREANCNIKSI